MLGMWAVVRMGLRAVGVWLLAMGGIRLVLLLRGAGVVSRVLFVLVLGVCLFFLISFLFLAK